MAVLYTGTPVKTKTMQTITSSSAFKNLRHVPGNIYTVVYHYAKSRLTAQTVTRSQLNKYAAEVVKKFKGKAKVLFVLINSTRKTVTVQYTPVVAFFVITLTVIAYILVAVALLILGMVLFFRTAEVGQAISTAVTKPLAKAVTGIVTSPWVVGGALVAALGYGLFKNPEKIGEIRRQVYAS